MSLYDVHYRQTLDEALAQYPGKYIDPDDFERQPSMLCLTGQSSAKGTRIKRRVTCAACLSKLKKEDLRNRRK